MDAVFLMMLVAATSGLALHLEHRRGRTVDARSLRAAAGRAAECIGLTAVFFAANLALGALLTLAIRGLSPLFVSLYLSTDVSLLVLSLLQALV